MCRVKDEETLLLFANGPEVRGFSLSKQDEFDVINREKRIEAVDYNVKSQMIFWADSYDKTIKRSYMINALNGTVKTGYAQDLNMKGKILENIFPKKKKNTLFW